MAQLYAGLIGRVGEMQARVRHVADGEKRGERADAQHAPEQHLV